MKRFLLVFACMFTLGIHAVRSIEKRIHKLVAPYEKAITFITSLEPAHTINDHDIFIFFSKYGLYEQKSVRNLKSTIHAMKKIITSKKVLDTEIQDVKLLLHNLEKVYGFVSQHAKMYYALVTYYEIAGQYHYIDEGNDQIVDLMLHQPEKLGLPRLHQGRGLYKFCKKIDLNLRRLATLFVEYNLSDNAIVQINSLKKKLVSLQKKIVQHKVYIAQLTKTRWLKAFGILMPILFYGIVVLLNSASYFMPIISTAFYWGYPLTVYLFGSMIITCKELQESAKYRIPVRSHSLFSWFMPIFLPLTWIGRD